MPKPKTQSSMELGYTPARRTHGKRDLKRVLADVALELPFRAELMNVEQLERHAIEIANSDVLAIGHCDDPLLPRLSENESILLHAYEMIGIAAERNRRIAPAAEWLLDNFYLIEEQIRSTRRMLPRSFSGELPRLANGNCPHFPRVYGIARELIAHTDGRVDLHSLNGFVSAYQTIVPLKLGELWAFPLMLRLALIENLRRVAARLANSRSSRDQAVDWAERMILTVEQNPTDLVLVLADMARENPPLSGAFIAELTRHLQGQNPNFAFAQSWLEHRLSDLGKTTEQLILTEGQDQAADQISVGNSITSLRFLSVNDWRVFVAEQSLVEKTLSRDPVGVYASMDFATRDRYRHAVEAIAKRSTGSEYEVAHRAVLLAQSERDNIGAGRRTHVGYYLVDQGRPVLERLMQMKLTPGVVLEKFRRRFPMFIYVLPIVILTVLIGTAFAYLAGWNQQSAWLRMSLFIPLILAASHLAIAVANWLVTIMMSPQPLPKMDYSKGIPSEASTLVVVPTMLSSLEGIERLLENLEIRYLANRDAALHYALLTDFNDAATEVDQTDDALLQKARQGIGKLNSKHGKDRDALFFLLHRKRVWNAQEKVWMGYERKRGKLAALNGLLRGVTGDFLEPEGNIGVLQRVRYVITLDTDTQLPRDTARELVGAIAHPLNRAKFDSTTNQISEGYTILQPRVGVSLPSAYRSWYVRLFGGDAGIDPYTRVVSDVYQDLFDAGSFVGKGIYDVDVFRQCCDQFPENTVLSHDLLESCYCRSALLSDVVLYEDFPASYSNDMSRRHRWTRGDWQIAAWLFPRVENQHGERIANPISPLSWWKLFDNLRRSLVAPALLILLALAWTFGTFALASAASLLVLANWLLPVLLVFMQRLAIKPIGLPIRIHLGQAIGGLGRPLAQMLFHCAMLPYEAAVNVDAIVRTLVRMHWTKRRRLEWRTSCDANSQGRCDLMSFCSNQGVAPIMALALGGMTTLRQDWLGLWILPWFTLWFLSPMIAWYVSKPSAPIREKLSAGQQVFLRKVARKTWRYFEAFATQEDNWLPPDNVQYNSGQVVSPRTSPTNIGMGLLSDLAAYDFGYCSVERLLDRTERTFGTLAKLEKYQGHFFNWYDTRTLQPLSPRYVSTVDSGNLMGQLMVLASGLRRVADDNILPPQLFMGLRDSLLLFLDAGSSPAGERLASSPQGITSDIRRAVEQQIHSLEQCPCTLTHAIEVLPCCLLLAETLKTQCLTNSDMEWWASAFERSCREQLEAMHELAGWLFLPGGEAAYRNSQMAEWQSVHASLHGLVREQAIHASLSSIEEFAEAIELRLQQLEMLTLEPLATVDQEELVDWIASMRSAMQTSIAAGTKRRLRLEMLAKQCEDFAEMDFGFLYDKRRDLFVIGFNVNDNRLDSGCYDLLASEARLGSYVLIARGALGQSHWFALGRMLTSTGGAPALLSWSGSMFEYLMPLLVMPTYEHTILDETYRAIVGRQVRYGHQRGVPWGISESGFNMVDWSLNYQYRAFGVPGLGLKRGLAEDMVVAPYASALGLMISPIASCRNLERLSREGREGTFGFYEAVDYTPSRLLLNVTSVTVRQFMAHHQGMSLLALAYALLDKPMQRRFMANPELHAADLLLHERVPEATIPVFPHAMEANTTRSASAEESGTMRVFTDPAPTFPEVHLLSNGRYHVMVTSAGGGYSRWCDLAVTRWREDPTRDCWGAYCYIRDLESKNLWSNTWQPTAKSPQSYEAVFTHAQAEFRRVDDLVHTHTQVSVSTEEDLELRRVTLTNRSDRERLLEVTSYGEVVLANPLHDESHPAFSNLFVQTEIVANQHAIYCTRRARSASEVPPWLIHMMTTTASAVGVTSFETDRMQFVGRGRTLADPLIFTSERPLSNTQGSTLDPVVSIRRTFRLQPNESIRLDIVTGVAATRQEVEAMAAKFIDAGLADRVFELAWTRGPIMLQQLNASEADAQAFGRLASSVVFASSMRRAKPSVLMRNRRGQSGLWSYGISGDLPIVLVRIRSADHIDLVRQAVQAHAYWRMKGLNVDLVVWNEDDSVYRQSLQEAIQNVVSASPESALMDRPGGIFVRRGEQMSEEDRALLFTVARVVLLGEAGSLVDQVERRPHLELPQPHFKPTRSVGLVPSSEPIRAPELAFHNGMGGFSPDGREYITVLEPGMATPAPWVNVIANADVGTVISERGSAYTWVANSHEFRLTPWMNDPVSDSCGEAIYLRDEETGKFWSPSPFPARGSGTYVVRHGFGYSIFDYSQDGIETELCLYVATDAPVKILRMKICNRSGRSRMLSVTGYWEWVLGESRSKTRMHVVTEIDPETGALFARNAYSPEFADQVAFVDCSETSRTFTGDRTEFIGRNGSLADPAAMHKARLSNRVGAGFDPCAALQSHMVLEHGQERIIVMSIGSGQYVDGARSIVNRFRGAANSLQALEKVWHYWSCTLGTIQVETPDLSVNYLVNGWLIYQTLACRMWARTGFYQSGGAFGYRDQLQDAMALVYCEPRTLRAHLLLACAHQFREGDVQHWWHPPVGRGVRTHFSDDYLWLPLALCRYVQVTGDIGILDESIPFLSARLLGKDEEANYDLPRVSDEVGTVYEHARRAIEHGLRFGSHGLPLMGCGDWNDGMNQVGNQGKGESVWLGFFLYEVMNDFRTLASQRGDIETFDRLAIESGRLRGNIEQHGWDGEWYRRAYFDDGTPLGSRLNDECQIDSLSQSWSILSGAGTRERSEIAMASVDQRLVRREDQLIQLLTPPFDKGSLDPGYIKGYVPGVRENGGQYTHAAIWTAMAFAGLDNGARAWEMFRLINPIHHGSSADSIAKYRVEPYVVAADVYGVAPHVGRGGWTWYTGSAGWMYRLILESLLGFHLESDCLTLRPQFPADWSEFTIHYRYQQTQYHLRVVPCGEGTQVSRVSIDGVDQLQLCVKLVNDGGDHRVLVEIGMRPTH